MATTDAELIRFAGEAEDESEPPELDSRRVVSTIATLATRAEEPRLTRQAKNQENWDLYWGRQSWAHKRRGQSRESLPDLPVAIEQIASTFERSLTDFQEYYQLERAGEGATRLDPFTMRRILDFYLQRLYQPGQMADTAWSFPASVGDAVKLALMEAAMTFKIYPVLVERGRFRATGTGRPERESRPLLRLAIDAVPDEEYLEDPSGLGLYTIHDPVRSIAEIEANPLYDREAVASLRGQGSTDARQDLARRRRTGDDARVGVKSGIRLREFWGHLIDPDSGKLLASNVFAVTANNRELLVPPRPNPFWHGRRPFVRSALLRVPGSLTHKAIVDHAAPMAKLLNEIMNLMLDGAMSAAWGVRQVRLHWLENDDELADGIPPGFVGILKPGFGESGGKFLERADSGEMPEYTASVFNQIDRRLQMALATSDLKLGVLPPRQTRATEIIESLQGSASIYEGASARTEDQVIQPTLELSWQVLWQYLDRLDFDEISAVVGPETARGLSDMSNEERFAELAHAASFRVSGMRSVLNRNKDFQKLVSLLQLIGGNELLLQQYLQQFSLGKLVSQIVRTSGVDPAILQLTEEERLAQAKLIEQQIFMAVLQRMGRGGGGLGGRGALAGPESPAGAGPEAGSLAGSTPAETASPVPGEIEQAIGLPNPTGERGGQIRGEAVS